MTEPFQLQMPDKGKSTNLNGLSVFGIYPIVKYNFKFVQVHSKFREVRQRTWNKIQCSSVDSRGIDEGGAYEVAKLSQNCTIREGLAGLFSLID